jgi:hypothetical protein
LAGLSSFLRLSKLMGTQGIDKMNTYLSDMNYLPQVNFSKNVKTLKFECVIPVSLERFILSYSTNKSHMESDPNTTFVKTLNYFDYEELKMIFKDNGWTNHIGQFERTMAVNSSHLVFPYPFNPRIYNHSTSARYDAETKTMVFLGKPFIEDGFNFFETCMVDICPQSGKPLRKMKSFPIFNYVFCRYKQIDFKKVLFTQVLIIDLGGWTNNESLLKMIVKQRGSKFKEKIMKLVEYFPENAEIEDYKETFSRKEDNVYVDGSGKVIYDQKIGEKNKRIQRLNSNENLKNLNLDKLTNNSFKKEFNHKNFVLHFESIFIEKEIGNEFHSFLKSEFNEEPWLFLFCLKELSHIKDKKIAIQKSKKIVEEFLMEKSIYEINISGKSKITILEQYHLQKLNDDDWVISRPMSEQFDAIAEIVKNELFHDSWKRFLRTKLCEGLIYKFQNNSNVCSPQMTENFSYTDEYFQHPFIFDQDFQFSELLFKDNFNWELMWSNKENKMNSFFSKLNYLPQVNFSKNVKTVKFECVIPVSFQRLILSYATDESHTKADPNTTFVKSLQYFDYETLKKIFKEKGWENEIGSFERNLATHYSHMVFPYPFNPRIMHASSSCKYDPENEKLIMVVKPYVVEGRNFLEPLVVDICPKPGLPMKKCKTYPIFTFLFNKFQRIDEYKVLFSQVIVIDMGGWTSNDLLLKMIVKQRGSKFKENLTKLIEEFPEDSKIEDFKEILCQQKDGVFVDGSGKLLYELKIDENNQKFQKFK